MQNSFSYLFPFFYRPKFISLLLCELHPCLNDHIYIFQIVSKLELSTSTLKSVRDRDFVLGRQSTMLVRKINYSLATTATHIKDKQGEGGREGGNQGFCHLSRCEHLRSCQKREYQDKIRFVIDRGLAWRRNENCQQS